MARLKSLPHRVGSLPPAMGPGPETEAERLKRREVELHWRKWYKTAQWQRLRWRVLRRDRFQCQWPGCGRIEHDASRLVADHIEPHRGDRRLFFDERNIETLCKSCHDGPKQKAERNLWGRAWGGG